MVPWQKCQHLKSWNNVIFTTLWYLQIIVLKQGSTVFINIDGVVAFGLQVHLYILTIDCSGAEYAVGDGG